MTDNLSYSKGVSWIDDCRIPFVDDSENTSRVVLQTQSWANTSTKGVGTIDNNWKQGRFPSNILVSDDVLNDGIINGGGTYSGIKTRKRNRYFAQQGQNYGNAESPDNYGDKGTNSRYYDIDKWFEKLITDVE